MRGVSAEEDPLERLDYYDLLQVDPGATADQVQRAFHAFALRYHPDRFATDVPEKQERAATIYRRGAEAYRVLTDLEMRRRYDDGLTRGVRRYEEPTTGTNRPPAPGGVMDVKNMRARPLYQKALEQMKRGDWKGAKLNLSLALGYEPDNALLIAKMDEVKAQLG